MSKNKKSFTLIEVLIFVSILSLFFVAAASVTIVSLRNLKVQEHKILATRYAEELLEWLRGEKEADWNDFVNHSSPLGSTYCFNLLNWSSGECTNYGLNNFYKRWATLTSQGSPPPQVYISIIVEWRELGQIYQVPLNTVFTVWE